MENNPEEELKKALIEMDEVYQKRLDLIIKEDERMWAKIKRSSNRRFALCMFTCATLEFSLAFNSHYYFWMTLQFTLGIAMIISYFLYRWK